MLSSQFARKPGFSLPSCSHLSLTLLFSDIFEMLIKRQVNEVDWIFQRITTSWHTLCIIYKEWLFHSSQCENDSWLSGCLYRHQSHPWPTEFVWQLLQAPKHMILHNKQHWLVSLCLYQAVGDLWWHQACWFYLCQSGYYAMLNSCWLAVYKITQICISSVLPLKERKKSSSFRRLIFFIYNECFVVFFWLKIPLSYSFYLQWIT